jgi:glycosyltransferase involved in cell wall biosynthesis
MNDMNENTSPLVSIVLCYYNEQQFLSEAVRSVIAQHYMNWELILVDDGSSDKSPAVAKEFALADPQRIRCIHHPGHCNEGLSASRNLGISIAQGEYVAFLDADDVWDPEKLTYQITILRRHPDVTVVLESSLYWNSWNDSSKADVFIPVGASEGIYSPPELMLALYPLGAGAAPCPSGMIVHASVLKRFCFEDSFKGIYQMYEDQAFLCKLYLKENVFVSAACHNKYRQRPSSLVSSVNEAGKYHTVRKYYLQWFSAYLKENRVGNGSVKALLRKASLPYTKPLVYKLAVDFSKWTKAIAARVLVKMGVLSYGK